MSDSLWVEVFIDNYNTDVVIRNIKLEWGRLYKLEDRSTEISADSLNGTVIKAGKKLWVCACGRSWSPSGTEGSFQLFDLEDKLIGTYSWDCPLGKRLNKTTWTKNDDTNFRFDFHPGNGNYGGYEKRDGTHIGRVTLRIWDASKPPYTRG
ncbi:aegerolysin family protein [Cohnella faecalis]|nr:aegerolysin family protein [Cohnella faecalis]